MTRNTALALGWYSLVGGWWLFIVALCIAGRRWRWHTS